MSLFWKDLLVTNVLKYFAPFLLKGHRPSQELPCVISVLFPSEIVENSMVKDIFIIKFASVCSPLLMHQFVGFDLQDLDMDCLLQRQDSRTHCCMLILSEIFSPHVTACNVICPLPAAVKAHLQLICLQLGWMFLKKYLQIYNVLGQKCRS